MNHSQIAAQHASRSRSELLAGFDGDAELLRQVASDFLVRSAELTERLRGELASGARADAARTAHTLKGLIAYFERGIVLHFAGEIEHRVDDEDFASAQALLAPLAALVETLRDHLRREVCDVH